jgi:hypothetical protein
VNSIGHRGGVHRGIEIDEQLRAEPASRRDGWTERARGERSLRCDRHAHGARGSRDGGHEDQAADAQRKRDPRRRPTPKRHRQVDGGKDGQRENRG